MKFIAYLLCSLTLMLCLSCSYINTKSSERFVRNAPYSESVIPDRYDNLIPESSAATVDLQMENLLWPICGTERGEGILMGPEEILYNEATGEKEPFGGLVIGGEVGSPVMSPGIGRIDKIIPYASFSASPYTEGMGGQEYIADLRKYFRSGSVEITLEDGSRIALRGLIPAEGLEEGGKIEKGQVLGKLHYYFTFLSEPGLYVEFPVDSEEGAEAFKIKSERIECFTGKDFRLAALYKEIRLDPSVPLSSFYHHEQPTPAIKDETDHYPQGYLWPVKGKGSGENVIIAPGEELLYSWYKNSNEVFVSLLIAGSLGDEIIALEEGTVKYEPSGNHLFPSPWDSISGTEEEIEGILAKADLPQKYALGGSLTIMLEDGRTISYKGIVPKEGLEEGSAITRGEVIGTMGYSLLSIPEPSFFMGVHDPHSKGYRDYYEKIDTFWFELTGRDHRLPELYDQYMTAEDQPPFDSPLFTIARSIASVGEELDFFKPHSLEGLNRDFELIRTSLLGNHPDLYHFITPEELEILIDRAEESLREGMIALDFYKACYPVIQAVKGDHLFLDISVPAGVYLYSSVAIRAIDGKLYVSDHSWKSSEELRRQFPVGTEIVEIDGKSAADAIREVSSLLFTPDGDTEAFHEHRLLHSFFSLYTFDNLEELSERGRLSITSASGEEAVLELSNDYSSFSDTSYEGHREFTYLTMGGEEIAYYCPRGIGDYSGVLDQEIPLMNERGIDHIILDLRNNPGGNRPTAEKIFSMFYPEPFSYIEEECVMDREKVSPEFADLLPCKEGRGFCGTHEGIAGDVEPSDIQYSGNVYVLTNPYTLSAAGTLAYLFKLYERGIIIGQGPGTPSGWINASQFHNVELPESGLRLRVPLVHTRNKVNLDEGVIEPDYEIRISLEDYLSFPPEERNWDRLNERKALGVIEELIKSE